MNHYKRHIFHYNENQCFTCFTIIRVTFIGFSYGNPSPVGDDSLTLSVLVLCSECPSQAFKFISQLTRGMEFSIWKTAIIGFLKKSTAKVFPNSAFKEIVQKLQKKPVTDPLAFFLLQGILPPLIFSLTLCLVCITLCLLVWPKVKLSWWDSLFIQRTFAACLPCSGHASEWWLDSRKVDVRCAKCKSTPLWCCVAGERHH